MSVSMRDLSAVLRLPGQWPTSLHPRVLNGIDVPTPFLACDPSPVRRADPPVHRGAARRQPFYAIKCNSTPDMLMTACEAGIDFEVASLGELQMLQAHGVNPANVLYSNTVKPAGHIRQSAAAGLWRFAFDSEGELQKIAANAPGSAVYIRVRVDDSSSVFPLSRKFGAEFHDAAR